MGILDFIRKYVYSFKSFDRHELEERLKAMAEDEDMKTGERSMGAMCYSPADPEIETVTCDHCGRHIETVREYEMRNYVKALWRLGLDCKLEIWCEDCCKSHKDVWTINGVKKIGRWSFYFVFSARLKPEDEYIRSFVFLPDLQTLYQFLINKNRYEGRYGRTHFVGEETRTVERLLGLNPIKGTQHQND